MNLATANALSVIAKGGRKAITEKSRIVAHPELHKVLKYQGFHVQSTKPGQSSYIHPKTGAKATVKDTGEWNVTYPKPASMLPKGTKKIGTKTPVKTAKPVAKVAAKPSLKMKVAAGGPGSGPRSGGYERAVLSIQPERIKQMMQTLHPHLERARIAKMQPAPWRREEEHGFHAGGVGSGRHKGGGLGLLSPRKAGALKQKYANQILESHGFTHSVARYSGYQKTIDRFSHPAGHIAHTQKNGDWSVKHAAEGGYHFGNGGTELDEHLSSKGIKK